MTTGGTLLVTAAESHERFRLGYPDEVVDRTLSYAPRRVTGAVEIGAGTGKAARAFASRGVRVTALESDPAMFSVLQRETMGMQVQPVPRALEEYDGGRTDLVYAAMSWQHTDPVTRCARTAHLLHDGGVLAVLHSAVRVADPELCATVEQAGLSGPDDEAEELRRELTASGLFTGTEEHLVVREVVRPRGEYVGYLSTLPGYAAMPVERRQEALQRLADLLPVQVRLRLTVRLQLARRLR
jgi:hypothetical protein